MTRGFAAIIVAAGLALQGSAAPAKNAGTLIDLSVAADGSCQAKIGDTVLAVPAELDAKLPALLPDKKAHLHLGASYETVPYRCFGPLISALQRLGYEAIGFDAEPPPLGAEVRTADSPGQ